jgi:hypothetical protein
MGTTPVNGHVDASVAVVDNQHKILEKASESYDCKPEKFSISCNPGGWIIPLSD